MLNGFLDVSPCKSWTSPPSPSLSWAKKNLNQNNSISAFGKGKHNESTGIKIVLGPRRAERFDSWCLFPMRLKVWWSTLGCMHKLVSEACLQASLHSLSPEQARVAFPPQCYTLSVWKEPQRGLRKQILPLDLSSSRRFVLKFVISRATWVSHICPELKTASH